MIDTETQREINVGFKFSKIGLREANRFERSFGSVRFIQMPFLLKFSLNE
jgi:hypothetical protein